VDERDQRITGKRLASNTTKNMAFLSHCQLPARWSGDWTLIEDCRIGNHQAAVRFDLSDIRRADLVVIAHDFSGFWKATVGSETKLLSLYARESQCRIIPLWRSALPATVHFEFTSIGPSGDSKAAQMVFLGIDVDGPYESDIDWTLNNPATPRLQILANPYLSLQERCWLVSHLDWSQANALLQRHEQCDESGPYVKAGPYRIYYRPPWEVHDVETLSREARNVILETFVWPVVFSAEVRLRPDDIVIDAGANLGTMSILFRELLGSSGLVVAIEPVSYALLDQNLRANQISGVTAVPVALDRQPGKTTIYVFDQLAGSTSTPRKDAPVIKKLEVITETLDEMVRRLGLPRVDFIKMDIEGAEEDALEGATHVLQTYRPRLSISSYHTDKHGRPQHDRLVRLLRRIEPGYQIREPGRHHIYAWSD